MTSMFEVLASTDAAEQERLSGSRAIIAAQARAEDAFGSFVAKADTQEERDARIALVSADLATIVNDVASEYGFEDTDLITKAATARLGGGHDSDCSCGFCANKGSFGKDKDDDKDDSDDKDSDSDSDDKKDDDKDDKEESKKPWEKDSSVKTDGSHKPVMQVTSRTLPVFDWEGLTKTACASCDCEDCGDDCDGSCCKECAKDKKESSVKTADGFSFCKCNCEGCNSANHCESQECIETKHSGNPGNPSSNGSSEKESKTAADTDTGDTFAQERESLPSSTTGLGDTGAVPTDKANSGDNLGWNLKPIDVPSNQHPVDQQQIHETPEYSADLPGVTETGKSVSADSPLQPEFNTADNTKTWTGTEGQANPVTNESINVLSKWSVTT